MKTIVLDAGHGGYDPGAVNGNRYEKDDNLRITKLISQRLQNCGQKVVMTRSTDEYVTLGNRSNISNKNNADIFVSLHRNWSENPSANGVENFVHPTASANTRSYAQTILNKIAAVGVQSNRGVSSANFAVLRDTVAPAVLVELGFISNITDNIMFDKNLDAYARAIADGILQSLGETCNAPPATNTAKAIQQTLNSRYNAGLAVDGIFGAKTKQAIIKGIQTELNRMYNAGLVVDGVFGPKTQAAIPNLRRGTNNNLVYLLQALLYFAGYKLTPDGAFGPMTETAVRQFQAASGLTADGIAGPKTFAALLK